MITNNSSNDVSMSSARFQIAKVSDDDSYPKKAINLSTSSPNASKKNVVFEQDSSASNPVENKETGDYDTIDALPHIDHYRNIFSFTSSEPKTRPTLEVLHGTANVPLTIDLNSEMIMIPNEQSSKIEIVKFGWIIGVLIRCVLNIFGVMLFLRLSWVTGQAGIGLACVIIVISTAVTVLTSLSMSAICTNGEVKGGGT